MKGNLHGWTSIRIKVAKVATIHLTQVFQTRGLRTAIPSHGGNFDMIPFLSPPAEYTLDSAFSLLSVAILFDELYTMTRVGYVFWQSWLCVDVVARGSGAPRLTCSVPFYTALNNKIALKCDLQDCDTSVDPKMRTCLRGGIMSYTLFLVDK
jgi:hypothetical protein